MKSFGENNQNRVYKVDLAINAAEIGDVKNMLIQTECNEIIDQSIESEKKLVMKDAKVGTKKVIFVPGSENTMRRTSLNFNFQK